MQLPPVVRAIHAGPTAIVTLVSFAFAASVLPWLDALSVAVSVFLGQCYVGWTNDLRDEVFDRAAGRTRKPLVAREISSRLLHGLWPVALALTLATSLFGPLGVVGTAIYVVGLASATAYNLWLKSTVFSVVPYAVAFGLLPVAIFRAAHRWPPAWVILASIAFSCAFHFLNVVKDLASDRRLGIMGLPQRLGKRGSLVAAMLLGLVGSVLISVR